MPTIMDDVTARLAARIAAERKARGWSPADLATQAGISRAMVAKVESGQSSPTAMLLGKLSGALGLTMSTLLARAEGPGGSRLVRHAAQPAWQDPDTGYHRRQVLPVDGSTLPLDLTEIELPAATISSFPAASYAFIRQWIWMRGGSLTFVEGEKEHMLAAGDVLELGPPRDCRFENRGDAVCRYVVIVLRLGVDRQG